MSNLETSLSTLASEINALDNTSKSMQVEMGHKLRAVRALLRERNGLSPQPQMDAFGEVAPRGWTKWVKDNLTFSVDHAGRYLRYAADPEGERKAHAESQSRARYTSPKAGIGALRRCWPNLSPEQRDWTRQQVIALSREMP